MAETLERQQLRCGDVIGDLFSRLECDIAIFPIVDDERLRADGRQKFIDGETAERTPADTRRLSGAELLLPDEVVLQPGASYSTPCRARACTLFNVEMLYLNPARARPCLRPTRPRGRSRHHRAASRP